MVYIVCLIKVGNGYSKDHIEKIVKCFEIEDQAELFIYRQGGSMLYKNENERTSWWSCKDDKSHQLIISEYPVF